MNQNATPRLIPFLATLIALAVFTFSSAHAQTPGPVVRQIPSTGQGTFQPQPAGTDGIQALEIDDLGQDADNNDPVSGFINRTLPSAKPGNGSSANSGKKAKSNPEINAAFDGLNFRQQRLANHGNQFSVEPPDQGLCAGNGFVMESVNDVVNVYDATGSQLLGVTDLNTFYGDAPAIVRGSPNKFGPSITDPSCIFDAQSQRWFQLVLTLDRINVDAHGQSTSQSLSGRNHLDLAVSNTSSPLGTWTIYTIPVQDDGTEGTPNHHCTPGSTTPAGRTHPNACLGDYPHIGADANGIYLTTNEFDLFGPNFNASQIYAISKNTLVSGAPSLTVFQYDTNNTPTITPDFGPLPGFTVWPAQSPGISSFATANDGTEYFLSSFAVFTRRDSRIALWELSNTQALNSGTAPALTNTLVNTVAFTNPPRVNQPGSGTNDQTKQWPLGQCIEVAACDLFLNGIPFGVPETIGKLNANDSRLQQVMFANGKLWGALGTGISTDGGKTTHAGIVVGPTDFPSVGYVSLDAIVGAGDVHIAQAGSGLQDGFTEYTNIFGGRPRWGDYGAAAVDGNSIWFATEFINQSCDLTTYEAAFGANFGSCGGTRTSLGNWATRITQVTP